MKKITLITFIICIIVIVSGCGSNPSTALNDRLDSSITADADDTSSNSTVTAETSNTSSSSSVTGDTDNTIWFEDYDELEKTIVEMLYQDQITKHKMKNFTNYYYRPINLPDNFNISLISFMNTLEYYIIPNDSETPYSSGGCTFVWDINRNRSSNYYTVSRRAPYLKKHEYDDITYYVFLDPVNDNLDEYSDSLPLTSENYYDYKVFWDYDGEQFFASFPITFEIDDMLRYCQVEKVELLTLEQQGVTIEDTADGRFLNFENLDEAIKSPDSKDSYIRKNLGEISYYYKPNQMPQHYKLTYIDANDEDIRMYYGLDGIDEDYKNAIQFIWIDVDEDMDVYFEGQEGIEKVEMNGIDYFILEQTGVDYETEVSGHVYTLVFWEQEGSSFQAFVPKTFSMDDIAKYCYGVKVTIKE